MVFFNTKEEVLDIQLTPYGKSLLSKGKWKPVYYEFFDDDVIYDFSYIDSSKEETNNEAIQRIKDTPRTKSQYTFEGADIRLKEYKEQLRNSAEPKGLDQFLEKIKSLSTSFLPLGNSSLSQEKYPYIRAKFLQGEIESSETSINITGLPNNIKIINLKDLKYKVIPYENQQSLQQRAQNRLQPLSNPNVIPNAEQEYRYEIEENNILIDLYEYFTDDEIENFEISLFEIQGEEEIKIHFEDKQGQYKVENNLLKENEDYTDYVTKKASGRFDNTNFAEYFFDIQVDKEIDQRIICQNFTKEEINKLKMVYGYDISCDEYLDND